MTTPGQTPSNDAQWALSVEKRLRSLQNPTAARIGDFVIAQRGGQLVAQRPGQQPFALSGANLEQLATTIAGQQPATTAGATPTTPTPAALAPLENLIDQALDALGLDAVGGLVDRIFDLADELGSWLGNTEDTHAGLGDLASAVFEGINDFVPDLGFSDLLDQIRNLLIPSTKVAGVLGPGSIGDTAHAITDQLISGFVGELGTGAGLPDLYNVPFQVSSWASLGRMGFEILGIRGKTSLFTGFAPTSRSNLSLGALAFNKVSGTPTAPTVAVTQSTALTGWHRIEESIDIGMVEWTGSGVTNITSFFINLWKMNPDTGDITVVHHSTNQVGLLSASMQDNIYSLPSTVHFDPGELLGVELHPIGGTHNVVGDATWRNFDHPTVVPRRWSSKRNAGTSTSTPSPIASASVDYATVNVPFIAYGISSGNVALPHQPETITVNTAGSSTVPIPTWANFVDRIFLPGAGGGHQGGTWGVAGQGGDPGAWHDGTWARGTDFTGVTSVSITNGAGGAGGGGNGGNGGATTVSIPGHSDSATGGSGATGFTVAGSSAIHGHGPGPHTYNGIVYAGGGEQQTTGADGTDPGGGGAGGNAATFSPGGDGAPGVVHLVFRQS